MDPENIVVSTKETGLAVLELNRPRKRNALSQDMIDELTGALQRLDQDSNVRCVILTSVEQSPFCAGADLRELAKMTTAEAFRTGWLKELEECFAAFRKPVIAAIRGFAFGGGFEIALMCDLIFASVECEFGFPEIKLGTMPGVGGTQRLTKSLGRHKATELVLTGAPMTAIEMERFGLVNKVCSSRQDVLDEALKTAQVMAAYSGPAIGLAKQAVKAAEATTLHAGLDIERSLYYSSFSLADCQEGIAAFLQRRDAVFQDK